jgi:hypothetical protein
MTSKPRGTALIINIYKTFGMLDRDGTMADCKNLVKLFEKLHFSVRVYSDVKGNGEPESDRMKPTAQVRIKLFTRF